MKAETKIYPPGLEEYPESSIIIGNLLMILWISLGTIACWFLYPLAAWLYLSFAFVMVGFILRKALCTNCYYYDKWCSMGWGKLSALFFKRGDIEKFNSDLGQTLAPLTYGLLILAPIILIVISTIQVFSVSKIIVLVLLLAISFFSAIIIRKKLCAQCKMMLSCKGCAAK